MAHTLLVIALMGFSAGMYPAPGEATHICAHRGDMANAPENTLPAIISAVEKGAHQIEFDVYVTKDDELVVIHDRTVDRTTDGSGEVTEMTLDEIRELDAGSWFDPEFAGEKVPTMREVLEVIPEGIFVNVHLKRGERLGAKSAQLIEEMGRLDQAFLACSREQAEEARAVVPDIMIGNMQRRRGDRERYIDETIEWGYEFIQLHRREGIEGLAEDVARLHEGGVRVNFFGTEDPDMMRALAEGGVDYILTDDLDLGLEVMREFGVEPLDVCEAIEE